ncbi:unnamed protein product [Microthlaspi erraticum]|uniref:Integrase catalytic domain-containing protein n=1 Tax=Microthlaspi erraticum TaxID=1685480 RepID=A0A6D2I7H9_9BRAS|nr:unnamed protein product [Microthlaspi erraticum]
MLWFQPRIVQAPNWDHHSRLCVMSDYAVGAVLGQKIDKKLNVIYYASRTMDDAQCKYATTEKELLTMDSLLQEFVVDKKGVENGVADHLSRMRVEDIVPINDSMPEEQLMAIMVLKEGFDEKVRLEEVKALRDENLPWHYYWDEPYLYKRGPNSIYRRCIAEEDVQGVLEHCHGSAYGGHFATFKTATKTSWDLSSLSNGTTYILVAVDYVQMDRSHSCPACDAKVVIKLFRTIIFPRYGIPRVVISDGGSHFINKVFEKLMKNYGVKHKVATPYHPQTSGQVEVSNRQIKAILEKTTIQGSEVLPYGSLTLLNKEGKEFTVNATDASLTWETNEMKIITPLHDPAPA